MPPAPSRACPMPRVSVVIPNYNHARYLGRRIESVLRQRFADFELLVLDDASPDASRDVALRYAADPRIRFHFNESNSGSAYRQWQLGLALTTAPYVWIAESDDHADAALLEHLVPELDADPRVGLAVCNSWCVDAEDGMLGPYFETWREHRVSDYDLSRFERRFVMDGADYARELMSPWNTIPNASAVLFRRSALESIGGPVTGLRLCGDWLTYCKLLARHRIARVPHALNYFRQHTQNVRSSVKGRQFVSEALQVQQWVATTFGSSRTHPGGLRFYSQVLIGDERRPPSGKVPARRVPVLLREALRLDAGLAATTARILAREALGQVAHGLGMRRQGRMGAR
jgi:glycosyltransferase involved in cell wall biosynthesis